LLATLNVEHHFVRRWGLANRVVVLDEVHADDSYTSGLIEALLRWLKAMRCSVVLMSAKLPAARLGSLLRAWSGSAVDLPKLHYPRVLAADATGVRGEHVASRPQASIELCAWSVCRAQPWAATAPSPWTTWPHCAWVCAWTAKVSRCATSRRPRVC